MNSTAPRRVSWMEEEVFSQPEMWAKAAALSEVHAQLPKRGAKVAVVGCGTSWFIAQSYATAREKAGQGVTDAYAASEARLQRDYDVIVALTRSGTTSEVLELLAEVRSASGRPRLVGILGDPKTPLSELVDDVVALPFADENSVVQTRFATTALALLRVSLGHNLTPVIDQASQILAEDIDPVLLDADQYSFLGTGWTVGLAHEAALKMREAAQLWTESYPAKEYRHGPLAIAAPGRVSWMLGVSPENLAEDIAQAGAHFHNAELDGMAELVRVHRVALERAKRAGLDPDNPRHLSRSVILKP